MVQIWRLIVLTCPDRNPSKTLGFYLSPGYEQALALAKQKTEQLLTGVPFVTTFEFDEEALNTLELTVKFFDDYCQEWAEFVFVNRDRDRVHPAHSYDIVIGPIADDGVTYQLRRFRMGVIPMDKLIEELKYAKGLTIQYYFGTERALSYLKKL